MGPVPANHYLTWRLQRGDTGDKNANAKQKWFEEKQKRKHAELEKLGLDTTEMHRIETAEQVGRIQLHTQTMPVRMHRHQAIKPNLWLLSILPLCVCLQMAPDIQVSMLQTSVKKNQITLSRTCCLAISADQAIATCHRYTI